MKKIAVMGHGVVGSGVCELMMKNAAVIEKRCREELEIKYILDLRSFDGLPYAQKFIHDFDLLVNDPEVSIVVEVMGGVEPAYSYAKACLERGKSVVTSNKALVAAKGTELLKIAREHHAAFLFEAAVGGGIPIIQPLCTALNANRVTQVAGILNGTTNFILTKMIRENEPFEKALKTAQELGYAERDPSADVEGMDACRKICILASLVFGYEFSPETVKTEGITAITAEDVRAAEALGCVIKLIGQAKKVGDKVSLIVAPMLVAKNHPLASVEDVFNSILVHGDAVGDAMFYGAGAGKFPTASAVVSDVMNAAVGNFYTESMAWKEPDPQLQLPHEKRVSAFMLRTEDSLPEDVAARKVPGAVLTHPISEARVQQLKKEARIASAIRVFSTEDDHD